MVAHVVRLRIAETLVPFRSPGWVRALAALACAVVVAAAGVWGALALVDLPADTSRVATVAVGSVISIAFFLAPFGASRPDPLDPAAYALLPVSRTGVAIGGALASLISVPVVAVLALDIALAITAVAHGAPVWAAAVGAACHVITCGLLARLGFAVAVRVRLGGRAREGAVLVLAIGIAVVVPLVSYAVSSSWYLGAPAIAVRSGEIVALTPPGAAAGVIGAGSFASLGVALGTIVVAACCWAVVVRRAFSSLPPSPTAHRSGLGWLGLFPRTATGAIGARSVIYWAVDVRYLANLVIIPVAGLLPVVPLMIAGVPADIVALVPLPIIAAFIGWIAHNDLAYDSEALWLHLVTGVRGTADRLGRLVPIAIFAIPVLSATIALTASFADAWDHLGSLVGVALALTLAGFGVSSVSSAAVPYPVARPGDSPFRQPQRAGARGAIAPTLVLLLTIAAGVPAMIPAAATLLDDAQRDAEVLLTGTGTGAAVLIVGVLVGALIFQRRGHLLVDIGRVA